MVGGSQVRTGSEDQQFLRNIDSLGYTVPILCCKTRVGRSALSWRSTSCTPIQEVQAYSATLASLLCCPWHPASASPSIIASLLRASLPPRAGCPDSASRSWSKFALSLPDCTVPLAAMGSVPRSSARVDKSSCSLREGQEHPQPQRGREGSWGQVLRQGPVSAAAGRALRCAFWHGPGPLLSR